MQQTKSDSYVGLENDQDGGMTYYGRVVMDARVFGLIDPDETCAGWKMDRMQTLVNQVAAEWDKHGNIPSRLPDDLRAKHSAEYEKGVKRARDAGWDPDANLEDF